MPKNTVSDFQGCSFKGIDLSRNLTEWKDTRQFAIAAHRFWRRDGAEVEVLGRKPHQARVTLAYAGSSWRKDWLPLAASLDADPSGPLVHPVYGQMPAVCEGFAEASMNIEAASNLYIVPLTFVEDHVGAALGAPDSTPRVLADRAQKHGAALLKRAPQQGPVQDSILRFVTTAVGYANAVLAAIEETASYARLLDAEIESVEADAIDARGTVGADPRAATDPARYDTIALIELLYDDCAQLAATATAVTGSGLVDYYVPSTTHVAILATRFYGSDGTSRIFEILANNAGRIPNPAAISAGTVLRMAPPTVASR